METGKISDWFDSEETTSLLLFENGEEKAGSSNIHPGKTLLVDNGEANLITVDTPADGSDPSVQSKDHQRKPERRKDGKKKSNEARILWEDGEDGNGSLEDPLKRQGELKATTKPRPDEIAFMSNDDLPDPVLYADGCVDDNRIIMLCQRQEMERL